MRYICLALVVVSVLGLCGISFAEGTSETKTGKVELGAYGMLVVPAKSKFDTTGGGGAYARYFFTENIALEGAAEYAQWAFKTTASGASGDLKGDLNVVPLMATLQYHFGVSPTVSTYIGGGFTGIVIDGKAKGTLTPGGDSSVSFDNAIGGHVCGGLDWKLSENVAFNLDAKYTWAESKTSESVTDTSYSLAIDDMLMDNFTLRGGLSYKF